MKELIRFSLFRRFGNKATKLFNIIIFIVVGCACFADEIMEIINPSFYEKEVVYTQAISEEQIAFLNTQENEDFIFKQLEGKRKKAIDNNKLVLQYEKKGYRLHTKYEVSPPTLQMLTYLLNAYHKEMIMQNVSDPQLFTAYNQEVVIENKTMKLNKEISSDKSNLIFMFVTSVYFMMLSFISGVASEVVNEKATKTLELILTSVSARVHFYSKLIVGWLMIVIQFLLSASYVLFWLLIRSVYDQGSGLVALIHKLQLFTFEGHNFYALIMNFDLSFAFFEKVIYVVIFLLLGILLAQLVLVIISSFVSSIEEASNIQAPFYLLLLGFYYLVLAINNPHELSEGIGFYLSFVPFFNMLLMPCRILIQDVPLIQMFISAAISSLLIYIISVKGSKVYEQGVLDYSCKGFFAILANIYKKRKER